MSDPARKLLTADALEAFEDDVRAEIIGGVLDIEAMTRFEHGDAQSSLSAEIKSRFRGHGPGGAGGWWIASEVSVEYTPHHVYRHDLAGWRKAHVPARPSGFPVRERPDWACEILSANRRKDLVDKRQTLHGAGVGHYWLVDLDAALLTVLRHHADGYLIVHTVSPGEIARLEPFDAVDLDVARLFGDAED